MKILLTGVNGFLGNAIIKTLGRDHQILGLSRNSGEYQVSLDKEIPRFTHSFNMVIHAAGKAHFVPKTEEEKIQFHEVNVVGTENLLKGLEKSGFPKQFVFISSVSVYGQEFGKNINEEHKLEAKDAYGLSKIEAEILVTEWCAKYNVICTILRLPLLVGKNPPGNLGSMLRGIKKGYYFNIQEGKARKSMVLISDVSSFVLKAASIGGIYNLTDSNHPSFVELSSVISNRLGKRKPFSLPVGIAKILGRLGDLLGSKSPINSLKVEKLISDLTFDDSKAKVFLNWKPNSVVDYLKDNDI